MKTWYDYREAWSRRPWVALIAAVAVIMLAAGIVGTITRTTVAVVFVPGLAAVFIHHLIARKIVDS